jgi:hypothetical protein
MVDADAAADEDRQRGEPHQGAAAVGQAGEQERGDRQRNGRHVRPALPIAHLAREQAAQILRAVGAGQQRRRDHERERLGGAERARTGH